MKHKTRSTKHENSLILQEADTKRETSPMCGRRETLTILYNFLVLFCVIHLLPYRPR